VLLLAFLVPVLVVGGAPDSTSNGLCVPPGLAGGATVNPAGLPASIGRFKGEQVSNAAAVLGAGQALGVDLRGQTIGVMTAIGESDLVNIDYGDAAGPDSRGILAQRDNGAWGSYTDRMTPVVAARNFYQALLKVPGWQTMPPTAAAHAVQRNQDPSYYTQFWDEAVQVVSALSGIPDLAARLPAGGGVACAAGASGGFALPLPRDALSLDVLRKPHHDHAGADLPAPTGTPISAVESGTVTAAGPMSGFGSHFVAITDSSGWSWYYGHGSSHSVSVGQQVQAGQVIAAVGNEGFSTGPHLHLGLNAPGQTVPTSSPSSYRRTYWPRCGPTSYRRRCPGCRPQPASVATWRGPEMRAQFFMSPPEHRGSPTGRRLADVGLGVVLALSVCACGEGRSSVADRATQSTSPTASPQPSVGGGVDQGATDYLPSQTPAGRATPDPAAAADALARAGAFLVAFARTDLPQEQWWAGIAPYFTASAAEVYHWTDVRNVTARGVDPAGAVLLPTSTRYIAQGAVPATSGAWTVRLVRVGQQWQVERAVPPGGRP